MEGAPATTKALGPYVTPLSFWASVGFGGEDQPLQLTVPGQEIRPGTAPEFEPALHDSTVRVDRFHPKAKILAAEYRGVAHHHPPKSLFFRTVTIPKKKDPPRDKKGHARKHFLLRKSKTQPKIPNPMKVKDTSYSHGARNLTGDLIEAQKFFNDGKAIRIKNAFYYDMGFKPYHKAFIRNNPSLRLKDHLVRLWSLISTKYGFTMQCRLPRRRVGPMRRLVKLSIDMLTRISGRHMPLRQRELRARSPASHSGDSWSHCGSLEPGYEVEFTDSASSDY